MSDFDDYEREVRMQLADLQREYQERAEPLFKALADIQMMRPPRPIFMTYDEAVKAGLVSPLKEKG